MNKKIKILLPFLALALAITAYLSLTSESAREFNGSGSPAASPAALAPDDYQAKARAIYRSYRQSDQAGTIDAAQVEILKNQLLGVKNLPADYKDFHLAFVRALDRLENFLNSGGQGEQTAGRQAVDRLEADFAWLFN